MAYKYCVVWFYRAKSYMADYPRPLYSDCKMFRSLKRAKEYSQAWKPPANIYVLLTKPKGETQHSRIVRQKEIEEI